MHATVPSRECWTEVDFEVASDICMDVVAEFLAQARALSKLAKTATGQEKEHFLKLEAETRDSVRSFHDDAQWAKSGSVRVCKKAFSGYQGLLEELEKENSRGQFHYDRQASSLQPF